VNTARLNEIELHQKEPAVAEWLTTNLDQTQWQSAELSKLGFKMYGIVTNNTAETSAEFLFAKLCVPALHDLAMSQMTPGQMVMAMMELLQEQANALRNRAGSSAITAMVNGFTMYAIRDFMSEANDSVNYASQECAHNEWIILRKDEKGGHFEAFCIIRLDQTLKLGFECECGRAE
jgi:hypothetical protein